MSQNGRRRKLWLIVLEVLLIRRINRGSPYIFVQWCSSIRRSMNVLSHYFCDHNLFIFKNTNQFLCTGFYRLEYYFHSKILTIIICAFFWNQYNEYKKVWEPTNCVLFIILLHMKYRGDYKF